MKIKMGEINEMFLNINNKALLTINNFNIQLQDRLIWMQKYGDEIRKKILEVQEGNNCSNYILRQTPVAKRVSRKRIADYNSSSEETEGNNMRVKLHDVTNAPLNNTKNTSAQLKVNNTSTINNNEPFVPVKVKTEKKSLPSTDKENITNIEMPPPTIKPKRGRKKIKTETEDTENAIIETSVPKRVTRSQRSKTTQPVKEEKVTNNKKSTLKTNTRNDSDIFIQEVPVPVVVLTDSDSEIDQQSNKTSSDTVETEVVIKTEPVAKSKPGRKKKQTQKTNNKSKNKDVSQTSSTNDTQEVSVYEDAVSESKEINEKAKLQVENEPSNLNTTRVIEKNLPEKSPLVENTIKTSQVQMNCTVTINKLNDTFVLNQQNSAKKDDPNVTHTISTNKNSNQWEKDKNIVPNNNILTDDDDSIDVQVPTENATKTPIKQTQSSTKKPVKSKPIFSPYGNSPVKKRVAAFEKLGTADMPPRVTRTKTRYLAAVAEKEQQQLQNNVDNKQEINSITITKTEVVKKTNYFTPIMKNKIPSLIPQTDGKQYKTVKNTSDISIKSASAIKPSRIELQERREEAQKRKLEREEEVKRKKEALLQAKIEEQKRKREEKQLKVQKAREAQDREKEEKIRRLIQEKEEKLQLEEQMKREWMIKKAAEEEKRKKMEEHMLKMKQIKLKQKQEEYEKRKRLLNQKPPPLPTGDLEDSDEEEGEQPSKPKYVGPLWSQRQNLHRTLLAHRYIPNKIIEELFQMKAQTPDLREIFETVDERVLRRNSSAIWRTPPRYSTLPKF